MKALSIKQPWAWALLHAGKNIENRSRRTHYRGPLAIHASLRPAEDWEEWYPKTALKVPLEDDWRMGEIIGYVDLVDCIENSRSKWFHGPFGYVFENPRILKQSVPCKGALGFWEIPPDVLKRCKT